MLLHRTGSPREPRGKRITIGFILAFYFCALAPSLALADDDDESRDNESRTTSESRNGSPDDESRDADNTPGPGDPGLSDVNLIALHDSSSRRYDEGCLECHAGITRAASLDPGITAAHPAMLSSTPGEDTEERCVFCHRSVDLLQGSAGNLRRQVDVNLCSVCHGPSGPSQQYYQTGFSGNDPDGAVLYGLVCSTCHRDLQNSEVEGESLDDIRDAILDDEGGMGPLEALTDQQIQAIAGALGGAGGGD